MRNSIKITLLIALLIHTCSAPNSATAEWPGSGTKPTMVAPAQVKTAEWPGSGTKPS